MCKGLPHWMKTLKRNTYILLRTKDSLKHFTPVIAFHDQIMQIHEVCVLYCVIYRATEYTFFFLTSIPTFAHAQRNTLRYPIPTCFLD